MDLVEIHIVEAQSSQAVVDRLEHVLARQPALVRSRAHRVEHLGGDDHSLALHAEFLQRPPEDLLALAFRVHVGRVEEVDSQIQRLAHDGKARLLGKHPVRTAAKAHAAQADSGDLQSGCAQPCVVHVPDLE